MIHGCFGNAVAGHQRCLAMSAILLLAGLAALFVAKYAMRVTPYFAYITAAYFCVYVGVAWLLYRQRLRLFQSKVLFWFALAAMVVAMMVVQYHFDPYQLRVDRWSALHYPIQNLLRGEYPYLAHTHLGGSASPFPVWQLFHIPFYLLGNVGLSEMFTFLLFILSVYFRFGVRPAFLADYLNSNNLSTSDSILVKKEELDTTTWSPMLATFEGSRHFTFAELLQWSLAYSDNNACDLLFKHCGSPTEVEAYLNKNGFNDIHIRFTEKEMKQQPQKAVDNSATPNEMIRLLEWFYLRKNDNSIISFIWDTMAKCNTGRERIYASLPDNYSLVHKTGSGFPTPQGEQDRRQ